ncbi:glutaredoxin family protein [Microbacterium sp. M]|uniref:glutaredoxin family protein n=1 Tax=Microbacterium sp. M TaxID=3377125 RepID=UPI003863DDED
MTNKLKIYRTTNCRTCHTIITRLEDAGLPHSVVNVEEDPAAAQRLKDAGMTQAPVFGWKGKLRTIAEFPTIERELRAEHEAAA